VARAHRRDWAQVFATTAQLTRDLDLAEECAQDAFEQALRTWPKTGIPDRPGAWLTTTTRNRARDVMRRESAFRRAMPLLVDEQTVPGPEDRLLHDDRLRLVFTCCHPAMSRDAQIALTLRLVCGLSTTEVARAFLVQEATMAARITRAKKKISTSGIPTGCRRQISWQSGLASCSRSCTSSSPPATPRRWARGSPAGT
jgi:RNA polymerase sigma factor (sigma-70 family)